MRSRGPGGPDPASAPPPEVAAFHAEMDRGCSWWNPAELPVPKQYVLEHEQIHFALTEIHARRLGAALREIRLPTSSQPDAAAELQRRYDALLQVTMGELLRDATEFDEDTSLRYEPARQSRWRERVESELASTASLRNQRRSGPMRSTSGASFPVSKP